MSSLKSLNRKPVQKNDRYASTFDDGCVVVSTSKNIAEEYNRNLTCRHVFVVKAKRARDFGAKTPVGPSCADCTKADIETMCPNQSFANICANCGERIAGWCVQYQIEFQLPSEVDERFADHCAMGDSFDENEADAPWHREGCGAYAKDDEVGAAVRSKQNVTTDVLLFADLKAALEHAQTINNDGYYSQTALVNVWHDLDTEDSAEVKYHGKGVTSCQPRFCKHVLASHNDESGDESVDDDTDEPSPKKTAITLK